MKRFVFFLLGLLALVACERRQTAPDYVVQVSLGGWHSPDYSAEQIINRIDSVRQMIPVEKVIIGWSLDKDIYRAVGDYLHAKGIRMLLWLPVFAETEEVCDNTPAVDLWGNVPANYGKEVIVYGKKVRYCSNDNSIKPPSYIIIVNDNKAFGTKPTK